MSAGKHLSKEQIDYIVKNWSLSSPVIATHLGITKSAVSKVKKRHGCPKRDLRKYRCNDAFFDTIDTEAKAYWLGFLYADGALIDTRGHFKMKLALHYQDGYIIEHLKESLEATYPIHTYDCASRKTRNTAPQTEIVISSKRMFDDLGKQGCGPRKSLTIRFPTSSQVPDRLIRHFIRGYFDGDGCITFQTVSKLKDPSIQLEGTKEFLESLRQCLVANGIPIETMLDKRHKDRPTINAHNLRTNSPRNVEAFYHFIYDGATVFLTRKKNRFDAWLALKPERNAKIEANRSAKRLFSQEQVCDIRKRLSQGETAHSIAKVFNCCKATILHIKHGRLYKIMIERCSPSAESK